MREIQRRDWIAMAAAIVAASRGLWSQEMDDWTAVAKLEVGSDLKIHLKGQKKPVEAVLVKVVEDRLVVARKNEELSYGQSEVERIDARPGGKSRVNRQSSTRAESDTVPGSGVPYPQEPRRGPQGSTESSVRIVSKGKFETVYRKKAGS